MSIERFIRRHRNAIDEVIVRQCGRGVKIDDEERRLWVLNDEGLYNWARSEGVKDDE